MNKKNLIIGGLIVFFIISIVFILPAQKKSLEPLIDEQVLNLERLEEQYDFIVDEINRLAEIEDYIETPGEEVPSVENWSEMKLHRVYDDVYGQAKEINSDIERLNLKISKKINTPPLLFFSGKIRKAVRGTKEFSKKTERFLEHKYELNKLDLDAIPWSWDMGVYIGKLVQTGDSPILARQLRDRIDQLVAQEKEYKSLSLDGLDEDVKNIYRERFAKIKEENEVYKDILPYLDEGDYWSLNRDLDAYFDSNPSTPEKDRQERVEFWRTNKTVQAVGEIKEEWMVLQENFD